jgi:hypothetical protein
MPILTINIAPNMGENNNLSNDLCLQFTWFHLYMEIYLYAENLSKNKQKGDKYGHMETNGQCRKTWGHLGPPVGPIWAPLGPPSALALATSPIHGSYSTSSSVR